MILIRSNDAGQRAFRTLSLAFTACPCRGDDERWPRGGRAGPIITAQRLLDLIAAGRGVPRKTGCRAEKPCFLPTSMAPCRRGLSKLQSCRLLEAHHKTLIWRGAAGMITFWQAENRWKEV